jgi:hypothetical protein
MSVLKLAQAKVSLIIHIRILYAQIHNEAEKYYFAKEMGPKVHCLIMDLERALSDGPIALIIDSVATFDVLVVPHPFRHLLKLSIASGLLWELAGGHQRLLRRGQSLGLCIFAAGLAAGLVSGSLSQCLVVPLDEGAL